ncbi:MAG TPA: type VI secretion system contractile sheath large subunit [Gemmatimonadaceae bacterium]
MQPPAYGPFRIALIGDFSGRANRGILEKGKALAARRSVRVDRDSIDDAIAHFAPRLQLNVGSEGDRVEIGFTALDDFHPDGLYERLPRFRALRDAGARALASASFLSSRMPTPPTPAGALDAILGDAPMPPGGAALAKAPARPTLQPSDSALSEFVQRAVAPHLVRTPDPTAQEIKAGVDAAVTAELRAILHDADYQALEAAWREAAFLVRRLDTDSALQVHVVDISREELAADLATDDIERSGLHRLLVEQSVGTPGSDPWALLVALSTLGRDENDLALLGRLGRVARDAGAPFVSGGSSALVGTESIAATPDCDDWMAEAPNGWPALRASSIAPYVSLIAPRILLRLPYGKRTDECELIQFEENVPDTRPEHESYLWGSGGVAAALLIGEGFSEYGWNLRPGREISNLPLHVYRADGETIATPCAEAVLSERAAERLLESGLSPLLTVRDSDAVIFPRLQSIAEPLTRLRGRWNTSNDADGD